MKVNFLILIFWTAHIAVLVSLHFAAIGLAEWALVMSAGVWGICFGMMMK